MRYVFDLDDTLCRPRHDCKESKNKYGMAKPVEDMIRIVRELKNAGHYIIIHTARRMVTHNGNIKLIKSDVGKITMDWLKEHDVPFDELVFGKPYADIYVDDKSINPQTFLLTSSS